MSNEKPASTKDLRADLRWQIEALLRAAVAEQETKTALVNAQQKMNSLLDAILTERDALIAQLGKDRETTPTGGGS